MLLVIHERQAPVRLLRLYSLGRRYQHGAVGLNAGSRSSTSHDASKHTAGNRPLEVLPISDILRSLVVLSTASIPPAILRPLMRGFTRHSNALLKVPPISWTIRKTFYPQFCCGSSDHDIRKKMADLKRLGFSGTIMAYAKESPAASDAAKQTGNSRSEIDFWLENNLKTVELTDPGNFVAIKYTGAGRLAAQKLRELSEMLPCEATPLTMDESLKTFGSVAEAVARISSAAKARGVRLLMDAETQGTQRAIDTLTMSLMAHFNKKSNAVVYNTYQMYLKSTPEKLSSHLATSRDYQFTLGVKMVRGAYLQSEWDRSLIHTTKEDTDLAYDTAVAMLLYGGKPTVEMLPDVARCRDIVRSGDRVFASALQKHAEVWQKTDRTQQRSWNADVVFATHNKTSVQTALSIQQRLAETEGKQGVWPGRVNDVAYAQLLGMADELSLQLCSRKETAGTGIKCYKYAVWGSLNECVFYLLRRAEENRDSLARTKATVRELLRELRYRARRFLSQT